MTSATRRPAGSPVVAYRVAILLGPPGAEFAIEIAALVLADLSVGATIEVVAATQRLIRWAHGTQMLALAEYDQLQVWSGDPKDRDDPTGVRAKHYGADDLKALSEFADREISCALEPRPGIELQVIDEVAYARLRERPCFVAVRMRWADSV